MQINRKIFRKNFFCIFWMEPRSLGCAKLSLLCQFLYDNNCYIPASTEFELEFSLVCYFFIFLFMERKQKQRKKGKKMPFLSLLRTFTPPLPSSFHCGFPSLWLSCLSKCQIKLSAFSIWCCVAVFFFFCFFYIFAILSPIILFLFCPEMETKHLGMSF